MTPEEEPVFLSLHKIHVEKTKEYTTDYSRYLVVWANEKRIGPFHVGILEYIGELSFSTTFYKPPPAAAAICSDTRPDGSCNVDVHGLLQSSCNSTFSKEL
ncbi:hypothetical protein MTO96_040136 [Rhipicephalus appendiculatus]